MEIEIRIHNLESEIKILTSTIEKIKQWVWLKFEDTIPDEILENIVKNHVKINSQQQPSSIVQNPIENQQNEEFVTVNVKCQCQCQNDDQDQIEFVDEIEISDDFFDYNYNYNKDHSDADDGSILQDFENGQDIIAQNIPKLSNQDLIEDCLKKSLVIKLKKLTYPTEEDLKGVERHPVAVEISKQNVGVDSANCMSNLKFIKVKGKRRTSFMVKSKTDKIEDMKSNPNLYRRRGFAKQFLQDIFNKVGDGEYLCKYCSKSFSSNSYIVRSEHFRVKHGDLCLFTCSICKLGFFKKASCDRHVSDPASHIQTDRKTYGKSFRICQYCGKIYKSNSLGQHVKMVHLKNEHLKYPCTVPGCSLKFFLQTDLRKHLKTKTHDDPGKKTILEVIRIDCKYCGKRVLSHSMNRHVLVNHEKNKHNFICDVDTCRRKFALKYKLWKHYLIHMNRDGKEYSEEFAQNCPEDFIKYFERMKKKKSDNKSRKL